MAEKTDKIRHESRAGELSVRLFQLTNQRGDHNAWAKASELLGVKVVQDDLKVIDGIDAAIEQWFHREGVTTWTRLSQLSGEECRQILSKYDQHFQAIDPRLWVSRLILQHKVSGMN